MSIIQLRRDTTANWLSVNPVLAQGELGIAYNGDVVATIRIGNGASTWTQLPDFGGNGDLTQAAADLLYATLAQGELADSAVQPGDLPTFGDVVTHNASEFATAAQGTDARTPTAHAASHASAGTDPLTLAQSQVTGLTSDLAAKVGTSDPRLTDPRTPTSHAASHAAAGADPLTVAQSQVTNLGTDLALKADLASPALTGDPTAPTQAPGNNSTRLATTAYVQTEAGLLVPKSTVTTKGDLIVGTGSGAITRRGVGSNGQVLTADSTQTDGVKWATPSTGSKPNGGPGSSSGVGSP